MFNNFPFLDVILSLPSCCAKWHQIPSLPQSQMIVLVFVGNDTEIYHTHIWQSLPHYAIQYTASIHELFISELMTIITLYTVTLATEMDLKYLLSDKFDFHLITLSLLSKERVFLMSQYTLYLCLDKTYYVSQETDHVWLSV